MRSTHQPLSAFRQREKASLCTTLAKVLFPILHPPHFIPRSFVTPVVAVLVSRPDVRRPLVKLPAHLASAPLHLLLLPHHLLSHVLDAQSAAQRAEVTQMLRKLRKVTSEQMFRANSAVGVRCSR